jgi:hypothetical protein
VSSLIKKGNHYPVFNFEDIGISLNKKRMSKDVLFTSSCVYTSDEILYMSSWNKLFGFSIGHHHKNSVRVGWRHVEDITEQTIQLCLYTYQNGKRIISKETIKVSINIFYYIKIERDGSRVSLYVKQGDTTSTIELDFIKPKFIEFNYNLRTYFGGEDPAPRDVEILIV